MAKIRQFNILHYKKTERMLTKIAPDEKISVFFTLLGIPTDLIQHFLPLSVRKSPESYISVNEDNQVNSFITLEATVGNRHKWFIKRLFLNENSFDEGKQLIDFVIAKYGALGADTFCVLIDENDDTSAELFAKMCGFRMCSREIIWNNTDFKGDNSKYKKSHFIKFKNSYKKELSAFFNDCTENHFKFSLEKEPEEFSQSLFDKSYKYFLKTDDKNIGAYVNFQKINKSDILVDIITAKYLEDAYLDILNSVYYVLKPMYKSSNIFVLNRNYMSCGKRQEELLQNNGFTKIQTKILLVKDFYKPVKSEDKKLNPAVIFNEISGKPAFLSPDSLQKYN